MLNFFVIGVKLLCLAVQFQSLLGYKSVASGLAGKLTEQRFGFFFRLGVKCLRKIGGKAALSVIGD